LAIHEGGGNFYFGGGCHDILGMRAMEWMGPFGVGVLIGRKSCPTIAEEEETSTRPGVAVAEVGAVVRTQSDHITLV
jgi:hypothetical protein